MGYQTEATIYKEAPASKRLSYLECQQPLGIIQRYNNIARNIVMHVSVGCHACGVAIRRAQQ